MQDQIFECSQLNVKIPSWHQLAISVVFHRTQKESLQLRRRTLSSHSLNRLDKGLGLNGHKKTCQILLTTKSRRRAWFNFPINDVLTSKQTYELSCILIMPIFDYLKIYIYYVLIHQCSGQFSTRSRSRHVSIQHQTDARRVAASRSPVRSL